MKDKELKSETTDFARQRPSTPGAYKSAAPRLCFVPLGLRTLSLQLLPPYIKADKAAIR